MRCHIAKGVVGIRDATTLEAAPQDGSEDRDSQSAKADWWETLKRISSFGSSVAPATQHVPALLSPPSTPTDPLELPSTPEESSGPNIRSVHGPPQTTGQPKDIHKEATRGDESMTPIPEAVQSGARADTKQDAPRQTKKRAAMLANEPMEEITHTRFTKFWTDKGSIIPQARAVANKQTLAIQREPASTFEGSNQRPYLPDAVNRASSGGENQAIQQQLQQLLEQVRILQETLERKTKEGTSQPPIAEAVPHQPSSKDTSAPNIKPARKPASAKIAPPTIASELVKPRSTVHLFSKLSIALTRARYRYELSVKASIATARNLEKIVPHLTAPIVLMIHKRLAVIAQDIEQGDPHLRDMIRSVLKKYWEEIGQSKMLTPHLERTKLLHSGHFQRDYRRSVVVLGSAADEIAAMASPAVAPILSRILSRFHVIGKEADAENDLRMRRTLGHSKTYRSHQRSMAKPNSKVEAETQRTRPASPPTMRIIKIAHDPAQPADLAGEALASTNDKPSTNSGNVDKKDDGKRLVRQIHTQSRLMESSDHSEFRIRKVFKMDSNTDVPHGEPESLPELENQPSVSVTPLPTSSSQNSIPSKSSDGKHQPSVPVKSLPTSLSQISLSSESSDVKPASTPKPSASFTNSPSPKSVPLQTDAMNEQSLLEELFPEVSTPRPSRYVEKRDQYPKLEPPESARLIHRSLVDRPKTLKEQVVESFQKSGEAVTVLQLEHCSTELTESDFRRLIPKAKHIESWNRDGEFHKIIPGRDPLSLERLPFYYLLFKSSESANAYQNNATRLHKLAALHRSSSILSAIPAPKGFLEDGEDIGAVTSSYLLKPTEHAMSLRTLMQPYHPALRALIEQGGYKPIVPEVDEKGNRIYKVLLRIEGYEPSQSDLFSIFVRDAYKRGRLLTLRNESSTSIHRLRDIINLKTRIQPISTPNPRAYSHFEQADSDKLKSRVEFDDPNIGFMMQSDASADGDDAKAVNQMVMNRVYNRWMIEFDEEAEAMRFAISWHRRVLPELSRGDRTWKDYEEVKMCNCEVLW
jgi:hypothetical protein